VPIISLLATWGFIFNPRLLLSIAKSKTKPAKDS
jgi:hypothetical protein